MKVKSVSALKAITREQLLGNYGKLGGYVMLYLLLQFTAAQVLMMISVQGIIVQLIVNLIQVVFSNIFIVGMYRICMLTIREQELSIREFFYAFTHDPDKVVIVSALMWAVTLLMSLPLMIPGNAGEAAGLGSGAVIFIKCVLLCAALAFYVYVSILTALWIMLYIDRPQYTAKEILMTSVSVMKNHKLRYFYLLFNQLGFWLLIILTATIGAFWLMPFICVLNINFYEDVKGEADGYHIEAEG
jgi:uncharacterized membrane protein